MPAKTHTPRKCIHRAHGALLQERSMAAIVFGLCRAGSHVERMALSYRGAARFTCLIKEGP